MVDVIIPVVDTITYGGGNHKIEDVTVPEFNRDPARNEPVSWTRSKKRTTADIHFYHELALTEKSSVQVEGDLTVEDLDSWKEGNGILEQVGPRTPSLARAPC
jgi:hypothetical protein